MPLPAAAVADSSSQPPVEASAGPGSGRSAALPSTAGLQAAAALQEAAVEAENRARSGADEAEEEKFVPGDMSYENLLRLDYNRNRKGEGLTADRVLRMPTVVVKITDDDAESAPACSICLSEYEHLEHALHLPCGDLFHPKCIAKWFLSARHCPNCRTEVK